MADRIGRSPLPLRRRALVVRLVAVTLGEVGLVAAFRQRGRRRRSDSNFLVATTCWGAVNLAWLTLKGTPPRGHELSLLAWQLLINFAGSPPRPSRSFRRTAVTAPIAAASYAIVLAWWVRARSAEIEAGMAPGIGFSGTHLIRPQRPVNQVQLEHHHFGPQEPPKVVLLHGLGASNAIWRPVAERLQQARIPVVVPDLLGFGASRDIGTSFGLDDHAHALSRLLAFTGAQRPILVGHSFGCAVAAEVARRDPMAVSALVFIAPPAFRDVDSAKARLAQRGWMARQVIDGAPAASLVCNAMCLTRSIAARVVSVLARDVPEDVAHDLVEHSWPAYRDAVRALFEENPLPSALERPLHATTVVVGAFDTETPAADVLEWPHDRVRVEEWAGDHLLPLRFPERLAELVVSEVERRR